jgi:hypothetical protein
VACDCGGVCGGNDVVGLPFPWWINVAMGLGHAAGTAAGALMIARLGGIDPRMQALTDFARFLLAGVVPGRPFRHWSRRPYCGVRWA